MKPDLPWFMSDPIAQLSKLFAEADTGVRDINQNGVRPGPRKLAQFREAMRFVPTRPQGLPLNEQLAYVKLFDPCGAATWLITDWEPEDDCANGWCFLGDPECAEFGRLSLAELAFHKGRMGIGIEIDNWFIPRLMAEAKAGYC